MGTTPKRTLIQVRVTPEEKAHVEAQAAYEGLTVSDYARARLFAPSSATGTFVSPGNSSVASGGAMRVTSNSGLYASAAHVAAVEDRLTALEAVVQPTVADAIEQGTSALTKKKS